MLDFWIQLEYLAVKLRDFPVNLSAKKIRQWLVTKPLSRVRTDARWNNSADDSAERLRARR